MNTTEGRAVSISWFSNE